MTAYVGDFWIRFLLMNLGVLQTVSVQGMQREFFVQISVIILKP